MCRPRPRPHALLYYNTPATGIGLDEKFVSVIDVVFKGPRKIRTRVFYGDRDLPLIRTEPREKPTIANRIKISVENRLHQRAFAKFVYRGNMEISDRDEPGYYVRVSLDDPDQDLIYDIIMPVLHDFKVGAHPSRYSVTGIIHEELPTPARAKEILDSITEHTVRNIERSKLASWNVQRQRGDRGVSAHPRGRRGRVLSAHDERFSRPKMIPVFSDEDVKLVCRQAGVDMARARKALTEAGGDLARAILLLTT